MAEHNKLYKKAEYYDIVFNRDVSREVDFALSVYKARRGRNAQRVLDMACGPGYHALEFARRGCITSGLDLNQEMVALGERKAQVENLKIAWIAQDFRHFKLPEAVDLIYNSFDGLDALLTNEDIVQHFNAVAENLTDQGIYLIDLSHPREFSVIEYHGTQYHGKTDSADVLVNWGTNQPVFDLVKGIAEVEVTVSVTENNKVKVTKDRAFERMLIPQEIELLCQLSGNLKVVAWYGDFDLHIPFDQSDQSKRMIVILEKN